MKFTEKKVVEFLFLKLDGVKLFDLVEETLLVLAL